MIEKILVEDYDVLENEGQIGIEMQLVDDPAETAELLYDGGNSALLIRNEAKAYIMANIPMDAREKLLHSEEVMMIEEDGEDIVNSYMAVVTRVPEISVEDILPEALKEMLEDMRTVYGDEGVRLFADKFWDIK